MFFSSNRAKSLLLLSLISLQSFVLAETAMLNTPDATLQQTASSSTETPSKKAEVVPTKEAATAASEPQTQQTAPDVSQLDTLLNNVLQQSRQIDSFLQDIILITSNDQSLTKDQRSSIVKEITALRKQLTAITSQSFTQADEQLIYQLLIINKELCDHLTQTLKKGLSSLTPFSLEQHLTRAVTSPLLTLEELSQAITSNAISVANLAHSAETIGLTWYNKLYRGIDSYVFQPWQKYNVTHYSMIALGATAATIGAWWYFTKRGCTIEIKDPLAKMSITPVESDTISAFIQNPLSKELIDAKVTVPSIIKNSTKEATIKVATGTRFEQWLREKLGPHPLFAEMSHPTSKGTVSFVANEDELKLLGHIEKNAPMIGALNAAFFYYIWPRIAKDYYKTSSYITKKVVEAHNNLKGGSFKGRSIKTSFEDYFKKPTCTFDDIIGAENAKEIFSGVIDYLISPEKYDLAKITPEKGYLLTGPARTGKTYIAEAFAGEARKRMAALGKNPDTIHFLSVTHQDIQFSRDRGGIKGLLNFAKDYAPCILFIDEIDLLNLQRSGGDTGMLSDFLVGLSDFSHQDSDKQVIVIAATNRSENIDDALKRRGRLGVEIRFTYPSSEYRKDFLVHKLEAIGIATDTLDIDSIVQQTAGRSFNDLESVLKKALQKAKNAARPLDQEMLEQAIDSEIFSILPECDHPLSKTERQLLAASIAGEAFIAYTLDTGAVISRATINPYSTKLKEKSALSGLFKEESSKQQEAPALIKFGKIFTSTDFEYLHEDLTSEQIKNTCKQLLAGCCAQQIILGITTHNQDTKENMQKCYTLAKELVGRGIDATMLSDKMRDSFADKAFELVEKLEQEVTALLTEHKDKLEQLTTALLKLNTLNGGVIAYIVEGKLAEDIAAAAKEKEAAHDTTSVIEHPAVA